MPITITVEDGSIVDGANSFATIEEAREYATNRGVTLAPDDADGNDAIAVMLIKAMDWLRTKAYVGYLVEAGQSVPFPRRDMFINPEVRSEEYPNDEVPPELKEAQLQLVLQVKAGVLLLPTNGSTVNIVREKVGPIETEYSDKAGGWVAPSFPFIDALIARFLSSVFRLRTARA